MTYFSLLLQAAADQYTAMGLQTGVEIAHGKSMAAHNRPVHHRFRQSERLDSLSCLSGRVRHRAYLTTLSMQMDCKLSDKNADRGANKARKVRLV